MTSGKPMIENSDRGITLSKPLAWTILVALSTLVWFGGTTVAGLTASTQVLNQAVIETRQTIAAERSAMTAVEARVRVLENSITRAEARFDALQASLNEVKENQRETNSLLQQLARQSPVNPR